MKVLVISNLYPPEFLGGYELGCAQMVDALRAAGHHVRVVTSVSAHADGSEEREVARVLEIPPIYNSARLGFASPELVHLFYVLAGAVNPSNVRALGEVIEDFEPDVAYLWNPLGLGALAVLALLAHQGIAWVWHIMDSIPRQICGTVTRGPQLAREFGNVFPGRYIMCSSHVFGEIRVGEVELGERIEILPNWVQGERPPERTDFFGGGQLRILNATGTLCEPKGTRILIEAAAALRDSGLGNFTIDIYGREDDWTYRRMLHQYEVADLVRLKGSRSHDELVALYQDYDMLAFPTWSREPFGFVALEAAAAGCVPLITADCGAAEWLIDGVDCLKAIRSPLAFAKRISEVLHQEIDLPALARRCQRVVWREFHISRVLGEVERLLAEAASERRPPRGGLAEFFTLSRLGEALIHALTSEANA